MDMHILQLYMKESQTFQENLQSSKDGVRECRDYCLPVTGSEVATKFFTIRLSSSASAAAAWAFGQPLVLKTECILNQLQSLSR